MEAEGKVKKRIEVLTFIFWKPGISMLGAPPQYSEMPSAAEKTNKQETIKV